MVLVTLLVAAIEETQAAFTVAGIGASYGNQAANQAAIDLGGAVTRISEGTYDAMTVAQLRANYDVLLFTWASADLNADWATRIQPYLALGGGVLFEDDNNIGDLSAVVTLGPTTFGGAYTLSGPSALTAGVTGNFVNDHFGFSAWNSAFTSFITDNGANTVGLYSTAFGGRILLTGPDQDYHASPGDGDQYEFLKNELRWVLGGSAAAVPEPSAMAIWGLCAVGMAVVVRRRKRVL